jgi:hypothetical protein
MFRFLLSGAASKRWRRNPIMSFTSGALRGRPKKKALERHYRAFPAERWAAQTYASIAPHRAEEGRQDISSQPSKHRIAASQ